MRFTLSTLLAFSLAGAAFADDLTISGGVQLGSNYVDFGATTTGPYTAAPGTGDFGVTSVSSTSVFATAGISADETGTIQSLNEPPGPVALPAPFITFTGLGGATTQLTATNIPPGAVGPFTLSDTTQGAEAVFEVNGYIGTNTAEAFTAEFNMYFPGYTVAQLFGALPLDTTYCANIDAGPATPTLCNPFAQAAGTPEPRDTCLLAAGLLVAGFFARRVRLRS